MLASREGAGPQEGGSGSCHTVNEWHVALRGAAGEPQSRPRRLSKRPRRPSRLRRRRRASSDEQLAELQKLSDMHDQGILTDDEFNAKKKDILASI